MENVALASSAERFLACYLGGSGEPGPSSSPGLDACGAFGSVVVAQLRLCSQPQNWFQFGIVPAFLAKFLLEALEKAGARTGFSAGSCAQESGLLSWDALGEITFASKLCSIPVCSLETE